MSGFFPVGGSGGGGPTLLQRISGATQTYDFQNISSNFQHLWIVAILRDTLDANGFCLTTFNGDGGANYDYNRLLSSGVSVTSSDNPATTRIQVPVTGSGDAANRIGFVEIFIPYYSSTTFNKTGRMQCSRDPGTSEYYCQSFTWRSSAAISRVTLDSGGTGQWAAQCSASLYGYS